MVLSPRTNHQPTRTYQFYPLLSPISGKKVYPTFFLAKNTRKIWIPLKKSNSPSPVFGPATARGTGPADAPRLVAVAAGSTVQADLDTGSLAQRGLVEGEDPWIDGISMGIIYGNNLWE